MTTSVATPWILGLTGGIGSGKSAAAEHFVRLGVDLIDADHAARWVVEPGRPALAQIAEHFGASVLQPDGQLNRGALRKLIFEVPDERRWLEALLHPLITEEIRSHLARAQSPYAILVSPLLIESGQYTMTQRVLVIDVPQSLQIQRTLQRDGISEEQVQAILKAQATREDRLRHADDVLVNNGTWPGCMPRSSDCTTFTLLCVEADHEPTLDRRMPNLRCTRGMESDQPQPPVLLGPLQTDRSGRLGVGRTQDPGQPGRRRRTVLRRLSAQTLRPHKAIVLLVVEILCKVLQLVGQVFKTAHALALLHHRTEHGAQGQARVKADFLRRVLASA